MYPLFLQTITKCFDASTTTTTTMTMTTAMIKCQWDLLPSMMIRSKEKKTDQKKGSSSSKFTHGSRVCMCVCVCVSFESYPFFFGWNICFISLSLSVVMAIDRLLAATRKDINHFKFNVFFLFFLTEKKIFFLMINSCKCRRVWSLFFFNFKINVKLVKLIRKGFGFFFSENSINSTEKKPENKRYKKKPKVFH